MQTFEAIISILMIMTVFFVYYSPKENLPEFETVNWKVRGFDVLKALDESNELRRYAMLNDTTGIESKLVGMLPVNLNYEVVLCEQTCVKPDISSEKIISDTYFLAGDFGNITPKQVILYMWGSD